MLTFLGIEPGGLGDVSYSSRVVNEDLLKRATTADPFAHEAHDVLKELLQSTTLAARVRSLDKEGQPRALTRNEAVLAGLMVRCVKLHQGLLDNCEPPRMELFSFLLRGVVETSVNLRYLLEHGTDELFKAFVSDSLELSKELHDRIHKKVAERGGVVMPMEYGMLESVEETFRGAGMRLEDFDAKAGSAWSGGGLRRRLKALGLTDLYEPYFRVHSSSVHGNWYELYGHHLHTQPDGGFLPKLDFEDALQAPLLFTAVDFLCGAGAAYLTTAAPPSDDRDALEGRIAFCGQKRQVITDMYRRWRQGGTSAQAEAP